MGERESARLVITEGTRGVWARLESETAEEMLALEACDVQGVWTSGRGEDAISTLRVLADQLGYPVGTTERRVIPSPPPRLVVREARRARSLRTPDDDGG
jgi:hypothetical protein